MSSSVATPMETPWERTKANIKTIGAALLLAMAIRIVLIEAFEIEGPSMEPTLYNGDRVVVAKFLYGLFLPYSEAAFVTWGRPSPGEVVIIKSPADGQDIVKRVVAGEGDMVEMGDDEVFVNGKSLSAGTLGFCKGTKNDPGNANDVCLRERLGEHDYRISRSHQSVPFNFARMRVPKGHVFVMGDHRDRSNDSRFFGPVPVERIKGRALAIYWSNDGKVRWGRMFHSVK